MKKLLLATAVAAISATGAYAADTDSATVGLTATVASTCFIAEDNFAPASLDFSSQVSTETAILAEAGLTATVDGYCNDNTTTVTLASANGGLQNSTAPTIAAGTFAGDNTTAGTSILPYATSSSDWAGVALDTELDSDSGTAGALATNAINGTFTTTVTLDAQTDPVLAGTYTDTITLTVLTGP